MTEQCIKCPVCEKEMEFFPDDQIANYICGCGFMATTGFIEKMTNEQREQIKKSRSDIKKHYFEQSAKREVDRIAGRKTEIEQKDEIAELLQKNKKLVPLDRFNG